MVGRIPGLAVLLISACGSGCGGESCQSTFKYEMYSDLPQQTYGSCEVDFSGGHSIARYAFPDPCAAQMTLIASPQGNSPVADFSQIDQCSITLEFTDHARALAKLVGSNTLTMKVTCDGVLVDAQTIKPTTRECRV